MRSCPAPKKRWSGVAFPSELSPSKGGSSARRRLSLQRTSSIYLPSEEDLSDEGTQNFTVVVAAK
ncbi:unnamed protein product [Amoebophrya sp. A25]|nr:unnamed protein product [Amoebophrya sp. A25]|eukprot:GSA25T00010292001.1